MDRRSGLTGWADEALEREVLEEVSLDLPWGLVEEFAGLTRLSGSADERRAIERLTEELGKAGVSFALHEPECFISIPLSASVRLVGGDDAVFRAKTPAMSVSTGGEEVVGELVYVPAGGGNNAYDVFSTGVDLAGKDVAGKIVLSEGMASPGKVADVMAAGAKAGIFINPGEAIHEGICTTIWGTPDLDSMGRQPTIPVVAVNHASGQALIAAADRGEQVALTTELDTRWRTIPVLVAEIPGSVVPEEFVLLHGHLDSWHVGIGDNATGDATLLELARVFARHRDRLARSLRIAWWSGHSHGRYAGSTWYADAFAIDLARNCVAQVNCDSPGCRWATTYNNLSAMSETEPFVDAAIRATTGIAPEPERPPRAGDYSFNGIGISSYYMLSSTMSDEDRAAKGYYVVGGCGANIQWHTEGDTLEIADRDNLLRDMRMYAASVLRTLNAPLVPFDWTRTTAEFRATLDQYQAAAGDRFAFDHVREALDALDAALAGFYAGAPTTTDPGDSAARRFNFAQRRLARLLIPVNYGRSEAFRHDPALNVPPLPDLAPAVAMPEAANDAARRGVLVAHLTRGQNRLVWTLELARETVETAIP
ncbi:MAG: M28 family peptidase [Chloroflexota bacterium]|nr:M28 family peptidase [Chloroflexota bacterium]